MAKNEGKRFEEDFKNSFSDNIMLQRFVDSTASWDKSKSRFQVVNPCDYLVFNGKKLFYLELKSCLGKSMSKKNTDRQFNILLDIYEKNKKSNISNMILGYVFNFRDVEETYFVDIKSLDNYYKDNVNKQSVPISWCKENCILIEQELKRVRYKYNVDKFILEMSEDNE